MENQKEKIKQEERESIYSGIVRTFFNASRGHGMHVFNFDSPIQRVGEFAAFLFSIKNCDVKKFGNVPNSKDIIALQMGPSLEAGEFETWIKRGIANIALVRSTHPDDAELAKVLNAYIAEMRQHEQIDIIKAFDLIKEAKLADDEYLTLLEYAENYMFSNAQREVSAYTNPKSLAQIVSRLLIKDRDTVFDPFMGIASFGISLPQPCLFVGWDINPDVTRYAIVKLSLAGQSYICENRDSLLSKNPKTKYRAIVTFPPMGLKDKDVEIVTKTFQIFENNTHNDGQMIIVLPTSFCSAPQFKELRKTMTEKNYVDKIIGIPRGYLYGTDVSITIISLIKNRDSKDTIQVANCGESACEDEKHRLEISPTGYPLFGDYRMDDLGVRWIRNEDLVQKDYDWHPLTYSYMYSSPSYRGAESVPFTDYMKPYRSKLYEGDVETILSIASFESPFEDMNKAIKPIGQKSGRYYCITEPVLAVGYKATCLLYPIMASKENPLFVSDKEILYRCPEGIMPLYIAYLFSRTVMEQGSFNYSPLVNQSVNMFLKTQYFGLIPLAEQKVIVEEEGRAYLREKMKDAHMLEYVEKLQDEYVQEVRSRKHNMRPYLRELKASTDLVKIMLKEAKSLDELQAKLLPILDKLDQNRKGLSEIIDRLSQIDKYEEGEPLDISDALTERIIYYTKHTNINFELKDCLWYETPYWENTPRDDKYLYGRYIFMSKYDFKRIFDCIIENARVHGFEGKEEGHHITIEAARGENDTDEIRISIINDGLPFPEGFDINRYGLLGETAGKNAGTGDGGHQVVSTVKHFGGHVTIESTKPGELNPRVAINIFLPIYDYDDIDEVDLIAEEPSGENAELTEGKESTNV